MTTDDFAAAMSRARVEMDADWYQTLDRIRRRAAANWNAEIYAESGLTLAQAMVILVLLLPKHPDT